MCQQNSDACCWICLEPGTPGKPLAFLCKCPRPVHQRCLARWQLQSVGRSEETVCRFCEQELPDWTSAYQLPIAAPVMTVCHNGVNHMLRVRPGPEGKLEFEQQIIKIFGLQANDIVEFTFGCKAPGTDQEMALKGWHAYDAAVKCAAFSAGAKAASHLAAHHAALNTASTQGVNHRVAQPQGTHTGAVYQHYQPAWTTHASTARNSGQAVTTPEASMPRNEANVPTLPSPSQAAIAAMHTRAAAGQASDSAASSSTAFAAAVAGRDVVVLPQPPLPHTAAHYVQSQCPRQLVTRTVSTESTAGSSRQAHVEGAAIVRRDDVMTSRKSIVPSKLDFMHKSSKRARHAGLNRARTRG